MEDKDIVSLYFERNDNAITETSVKYRAYCMTVAVNILENSQDAEECVNDALHKVWNSIPPASPENLRTYIGKIVRNLSFDRFRKSTAKKRGKGEIAAVLDELSEIVSGKNTPETEVDRKELTKEINGYLNSITKEKRSIFVMRYWYSLPVSEIAKRTKKTETNVSVILNRLRNSLKTYLNERGYEL